MRAARGMGMEAFIVRTEALIPHLSRKHAGSWLLRENYALLCVAAFNDAGKGIMIYGLTKAAVARFSWQAVYEVQTPVQPVIVTMISEAFDQQEKDVDSLVCSIQGASPEPDTPAILQ